MNNIIGKYSFVFIVIIFLITSCQKESDYTFFNLEYDESEMLYQETQCADAWYEFLLQKANRDKSKEEVLGIFLRNANISFVDLKYQEENSNSIVTCTECQCYTGSLFYIKIKNDDNVKKKLEGLGFVLH